MTCLAIVVMMVKTPTAKTIDRPTKQWIRREIRQKDVSRGLLTFPSSVYLEFPRYRNREECQKQVRQNVKGGIKVIER